MEMDTLHTVSTHHKLYIKRSFRTLFPGKQHVLCLTIPYGLHEFQCKGKHVTHDNKLNSSLLC